MAQARLQTTNTRPHGADKRAYPRIPLRLAATCVSSAGGAVRACDIHNFCAGGLLLNYASGDRGDYLPVVGDVVEVRATWPEGASGQSVRFKARIMRADADSAGAALIDPDPAALKTLVRCAEAQRGQRRSSAGKGSARPDNATADALMMTCRERVLGASSRLAEDLVNQLVGELSGLGRQSGTVGEQQARIEFLGRIRSERGSLVEQFLVAVGERLGNAPAPDPAPKQEATHGALTLLGNEELEEWLSVSEIASHVESRLAGPLTDLEYRLGHLTGKPVDHQNNPFGPHVYAEAFQGLIESLHPVRSIRQTCFQVFKLLLTGWMETLCRDLNGLLIERGILPEIKRNVVRSDHGQPPQPDKRSSPSSGMTAGPRSDHPAVGRDTPRDRDLYSIVQDLRRLQHQYGHRAMPEEHTPASTAAAARIISPDEIISALSRLRVGAATGSSVDSAPGMTSPGAAAGKLPDLREQIMSVIAGAANGGQNLQLGARETGIIDVADTLFSSMLRDGMVGGSVRGWLQRLEAPLVKLALHDDAIFTDRSHASREVINKIAQLKLQDVGSTGSSTALQREVDKLVDAIGVEDRPDLAAFKKALKKLDLLIRVQNESYAENLKEVLTSCDSEPQFPPDTTTEDLAEEDRLWLKRVGRIKVDDWVLFSGDPSKPQRLRLAWISRGGERYVFVNVLGLKAATYDLVDLARCFTRGEAMIMDSADEPALDRAQYTMLQNLHRQLLHETTHDQLTGLMNRQEFERRLQLALDTSRNAGIPHSLLHLDLAQFSVINNTCGNDTGDQVLREIAGLLRESAGKNAQVARIGSDEFGIVLKVHFPDEPLAVARQLIDAVRNYRYRWHDESRTVSAGLGIVNIGDFTGVSALLQAAESSCRAARSLGMNQFQLYKPDDAALASRNDTFKWLNRIDRALVDGTLELRCQRIMPIDAQDAQARPHHSEILLGITDDDGTLISPQQFIITAEHYQRMPAIDRWVVSTVLRYIVENLAHMNELGGFAINLSGCSLSDESFKDFIREEIAKTGAPMEYVCFEITETAGITSLSDAADFIMEIRKTGCRFSLDDFGSGHSSFVYLKNLPVDYLKIDGGFVRDMDNNPADFAVVKSVTEIGRFMGKKIIAESVESEAVLAQLREIGVDYVQGYAIERPIRLRDLI